MSRESYTLPEAADALGISRRTLQRRIQEGAFPGRYLAPGPAGLEIRIPAAEVERSRRQAPQESLVPYGAREVDAISSAPIYRRAESSYELEELRESVVGLIREEREMFLGAVREALLARDREIAELKDEIAGLRSSVDDVRAGFEGFERRFLAERTDPGPTWATVLGAEAGDNGQVDVDVLLREIGELEAMLTGLPEE